MLKPATIWDARMIIAPFIIKEKKPSVRMVTGIVTKDMTGLIVILIIASTIAVSNAHPIPVRVVVDTPTSVIQLVISTASVAIKSLSFI